MAFFSLFSFTVHAIVPEDFKEASEAPSASLVDLEGEPSSFIHGCVSTISGDYCDSPVDLVVKHGVNPFELTRTWIGDFNTPLKYAVGWSMNLGGTARYFEDVRNGEDKKNKLSIIEVTQDRGGRLYFSHLSKLDKYEHPYPIEKLCLRKGITNTARGYASGQFNIKNHKFVYSPNKHMLATLGTGEKQVYTPGGDGMLFRTTDILPSGSKVHYEYDHHKKNIWVQDVEFADSAGKKWNGFSLPDGKTAVQNGYCKIELNDGSYVKYFLDDSHTIIPHTRTIKSVERSDSPTETYSYKHLKRYNGEEQLFDDLFLTQKARPDGRVLSIDYYYMGSNPLFGGMNPYFKDPYDPRIGRVRRLNAPAGPGNAMVPIYYFFYEIAIELDKKDKRIRIPKHGTTMVWDALLCKTYYDYDADRRLTQVTKFKENGSVHTQERFSWGENNSPDSTYLLSRQVFADGGRSLFARTYKYDTNGNIIEDCLYGSLTGLKDIPPRIEGTAEKNGAECYKKTFVYSQDGFNVPLEEFDGTTRIVYTYVPKTNKLRAKYQGDKQKWYLRWFYVYNEDGAVIEEICDDGCGESSKDLSGVTHRKMVKYEQRKEYPIAYPNRIDEYFLDMSTGRYVYDKGVVNTYDKMGRISAQDHYDANKSLAYTLKWSHDLHGNVLSETDAMGNVITRKFDANDNCIYEKGPHPSFQKEFTYDAMNRLIREEEVHSDGIRRTTHHRYDLVGNRLATIDPNGHETRYDYDEFGRVLKVHFPPILDENGNMVHPKVMKAYNELGALTGETDTKGNTMSTTFTIRGKPVRTNFPDGSSETIYYNLNGTVREKIGKNGTRTQYSYDPLGRIVHTDVVGASGVILKTFESTYSGFNILTSTDPMGLVTSYTYFPNGKVKTQSVGDKVTSFEYDALGNMTKATEQYCPGADDYYFRKYAYDLLGRKTHEECVSATGDLHTAADFTYDVVGNVTSMSVKTPKGDALTVSRFDSHGTPTMVKDPLGNTTTTFRRYDFRNAHGQTVGYKEVTDPEGNTTCVEEDVMGRVVHVIRKDRFGKTKEEKENFYDLCGNCCRIIDRVVDDRNTTNEIVTVMQYDSMNRVRTTFQAFGRPEQKVTEFGYDIAGSTDRVTKFDGTAIHHSHDPIGRVSQITASDNSIDYVYSYDRNDHVVLVEDAVHGISTAKKYDINNFLEENAQGNGLTVGFVNDALGRILRVDLPDSTAISYKYDGVRLGTVAKIDATGNTAYQHTYDDFDLSGKVLATTLPGNAGKMSFSYDLGGRLEFIMAPQWSQNIDAYDKAGNILTKTTQSDGITDTFAYTYDPLYQLTGETGPHNHAYTYDSHFNRRSKDGVPCVYNDLDQLISDGTYTYSYDLNGNRITKTDGNTAVQYIYDAFDRLVSVTEGDLQTRYLYDETHRRLAKISCENVRGVWKDIGRQDFLYQGENDIGAVDSEGNITELRLLGIGKGAEIGAAVALELQGKMYVPLHDHNGNTAGLIDGATGILVETYSYTAFGEYEGDAITPWLFSSKRHDKENGLVYYGRRYYDPATAQWITEDPLGREAGPNRYAFVQNNPVMRFDLYGLIGQNSFSYMDSFCRSLERFVNGIFRLASPLTKLPGSLIKVIGDHVVPIPYIRDAVAFAGACLCGQAPREFWTERKHEKSDFYVHEGYGDLDPLNRLVVFNGMNTTREEFFAELARVSAKYGGRTVYGVYNSTQGTALDSIEYLCQTIGIPTRMQSIAEGSMKYLANDMDQYGNGGVVSTYCHSQGAETVHNLSEGVRKRMDVTALGPARILDPTRFLDARNFCSGADPISKFANPLGYMKGIRGGYLTVLRPHGHNPFTNHSLSGPVYSSIIAQGGLDYKQKNGWVETVR